MTSLKEYLIQGCAIPTEKIPVPNIYKMTVFEKNEVCARSTFTKMLKRKYKLKEILILKIIEETKKESELKIYGIKCILTTQNRKINMYKEFKGINKAGVVEDLYNDLGGRHSAKRRNVHVVSVVIVDEPKRKFIENEFPRFGRRLERGEDFVLSE